MVEFVFATHIQLEFNSQILTHPESGTLGPSWWETFMTVLWCYVMQDVGGRIIMLATFSLCWWVFPNRSPTFHTRHQQISSSISVANIDVTHDTLAWYIGMIHFLVTAKNEHECGLIRYLWATVEKSEFLWLNLDMDVTNTEAYEFLAPLVRVMCLILPETLTVRFECSALNYDNWNVTLVFNLQFYVWIITLKGFITVLCFPVIFKEYNTFSHRDREILFKNLINIQLAIIIIIVT